MKIKGLDFLRGIAIFLVLFRHAPMPGTLRNMGWIGVDLFFVLSGFLVSGLIFNEYKNTNTVNVGRFLIRRGLKIYPAFYIYTLISLVFAYVWYQITYKWQLVFGEISYLQSYLVHINVSPHTWSLAVEEHFYLLLAIITFLLTQFKFKFKKEFIIYGTILLLILIFITRYKTCYQHRQGIFYLFETHFRADGILIGILLSYLFHFTTFCHSILKYKYILLPIAIVFIFPVFIFRFGSFFLNAIGLAILNIGLGIVVLFALDPNFLKSTLSFFPIKAIRQLFCFIGTYSYSIYLWHMIVLAVITDAFDSNYIVLTGFYIVSSLVIGITLYYLIENPFLKWRDRAYPSTLSKFFSKKIKL